MIPGIDFITARIPPPRSTQDDLVDDQTTRDIIDCVKNSIKISAWYTKRYAYIFADSGSIQQTCNDVWSFMKNNFQFKPETGKHQTGRSVRYIIYNPNGLNQKSFDCKHYATFAVATLQALGLKCNLRVCGYTPLNRTPTHIYAVCYDNAGKEIIIDGTLSSFNVESNSNFKWDVK